MSLRIAPTADRHNTLRATLGVLFMLAALVAVGTLQSWSLALNIVNLCLISSIMALGINVQWGYAGLFNVGIMGFTALGGLAAMLVSVAPVGAAWRAGGGSLLLALSVLSVLIFTLWWVRRRLEPSALRMALLWIIGIGGLIGVRQLWLPATAAIEAVNPSRQGFLGGLGLPILLSWPVGALFAAAAAWLIGRITLGLRSDYLAIATLGISEIIIAVMKHEDWLSRGVKNVSGLPRTVPYEIDLQQSDRFRSLVESLLGERLPAADAARTAALNSAVVDASSITVKLCYTGLFSLVLLILLWLASRAQRAPWGRMMRAIRDNETAARAMGKHIEDRHLQVFVVGSAIVGLAGAMLTTLDGQLTPGTYHPLRYTFLIWVMVIVGGSGNNLGSVLGAFLIWLLWIEAEPIGRWLMVNGTAWLGEDSSIRQHLVDNAPHMRLFLMGAVLLLVLRFSPHGLLPERIRR